MKSITLYSNNCPRCKVLKKKLDTAEIDYEIESDEETMIEMGFTTVPILEVNGNYLKFNEAMKWIDESEEI